MKDLPDLVSGPDIERKSFEIIDAEVGDHGFDETRWTVVRRIIHASGDLGLVKYVRFGGDPISSAISALKRGCPIISDTRMATLGISMAKLQKINPSYTSDKILCAISEPSVIEQARASNMPRSVFNIRHLKQQLDGSIVLVGNAPTALWEVLRLYHDENLRPACVVGMPVGFVNVSEVKKMLMETDLDYITITGRRGGTPLAVATLNALASHALLA